jgi:hypothetical protein
LKNKKTIIVIVIFALSLVSNLLYLKIKLNERKDREEFFTLFEINNTNYKDGFIELNQKIREKSLQKPYYIIQIWDTRFLEFNKKIPYLINVDSICKVNKNIQGILISAMRDESINKCLKEQNIQFKNFVIINNMENYISGICNLKHRKTKPDCATIVVKQNGDILYYNSKIINHVSNDTSFLNLLTTLK